MQCLNKSSRPFCLGVASKGSWKGLRQGFRTRVESKGSEDRGNPIWQAALGLKKSMAPTASIDRTWVGGSFYRPCAWAGF